MFAQRRRASRVKISWSVGLKLFGVPLSAFSASPREEEKTIFASGTGTY